MSSPPSTFSSNTRRSTRIKEKKRKLENPTFDNSSEINATKQKKYKTNKNGNGNGQVDHDGKLDDDTIPPYNKTVRNELQEMPHNTIYWLCFTNQLSYYILNNAGSYGQEEELQHIPNLVNTLVSYYSQQADCFALLINDINTIHEYDDDTYYSIKGFDESMPASYYVTHADLAKSLDKATVHDDDDDDDEQSTTSTSNASTKIGKDDEQNGEVGSINGGISMDVELIVPIMIYHQKQHLKVWIIVRRRMFDPHLLQLLMIYHRLLMKVRNLTINLSPSSNNLLLHYQNWTRGNHLYCNHHQHLHLELFLNNIHYHH